MKRRDFILAGAALGAATLLPTTPAHEWDELMVLPAYMHALGLIP